MCAWQVSHRNTSLHNARVSVVVDCACNRGYNESCCNDANRAAIRATASCFGPPAHGLRATDDGNAFFGITNRGRGHSSNVSLRKLALMLLAFLAGTLG
jgi:hypothetical protein